MCESQESEYFNWNLIVWISTKFKQKVQYKYAYIMYINSNILH